MYPWFAPFFRHLCMRAREGKLHHGILLQGPSGLGKSNFALQLGQYLLCTAKLDDAKCGQCQSCTLNAAGTHPDLHIVESDKQIGVDQIREAIKSLAGSSQMSGAKVLIIYGAHTMTESSANALLKTLEEPTSNTFLILTTDKPERILATIKSRCEKMVLPVPPLDMTIDWVKSQYSGEVDTDFAKLFASRPLALLAELQDDPKFTYQVFSSGLEGLLNGRIGSMQLSIDWQENPDKVLKWLQYWLHQQTLKQVIENDVFWQIHQQSIKTARQLNNPGINKILLLGGLLDSLATSRLTYSVS